MPGRRRSSMPGEEDFGMTMVESLASGKPVIALGRGGAVEIVREKCGVLYQDATEAGLEDALRTFDRIEPSFNPLYLGPPSAEFSESVFERNFGAALAGYVGRVWVLKLQRPNLQPVYKPLTTQETRGHYDSGMPTQAAVHPELYRMAQDCPESLTDEEVMLVLCDSPTRIRVAATGSSANFSTVTKCVSLPGASG